MTKRVGIIGYPLGHSMSPVLQQAAFDHYGLDVRYQAWETALPHLEKRIRSLRQPDVLGAGVTVPHKEAVAPYMDEVKEEAALSGAVNTIVNLGGRLVAYNTDVYGFTRALREDGGFDARGKSALILGAGGAARAVALALEREGVGFIVIANRTLERAEGVVPGLQPAVLQVEVIPLSQDSLVRAAAGSHLIVNCTTLGMKGGPGEGVSPLTAAMIPSRALVYDLVYNPPETPLLKEAKKAGARTLGGLPMLVYQGAVAFKLWTGKEAPAEVMMEAAQRALGGQRGTYRLSSQRLS